MTIEPILKWAGGKRRLIQEIKSLFPSDFRKRRYHEPFFGGGAIFFNISPKSATINDLNERLMNFYKVVRDNPEELIELTLQYTHDKQTYYTLREKFNEHNLNSIEEASLLLYLNKTAYNGLYRVNSKGAFNVPFGKYKNPKIVDIDRIREVSQAVRHVEIYSEDFTYVIKQAHEGDICYLDPPYQPISSTAKFTSYSSNGFSFNDQLRLRDTCITLNDSGVFFVLSNSYSKKIIDLYRVNNFRIEIIEASRNISSKASTRGPVYEILVTNIPSDLSFGDIVIQYRLARFKRESNFNSMLI